LDDQQPWPFSPKGEAAAEIRTGANASKQELTQTDLARFRFVHFATHGILPVEAEIKEPALVLSYIGNGNDDMAATGSRLFRCNCRGEQGRDCRRLFTYSVE